MVWFSALPNMTIRAEFTAGGLSKKSRCVYLLTVRAGKQKWHYVGRTGTSNKTGFSSPYQRLAKHLAKVGKTQSCIWDADCLPPKVLDRAIISFLALPIAQEDEVRLAEKWLHWRFADKPSLNKENPPTSEPKISGKLRARLCFTYKKEIGQPKITHHELLDHNPLATSRRR
jgi:hypothetical protein